MSGVDRETWLARVSAAADAAERRYADAEHQAERDAEEEDLSRVRRELAAKELAITDEVRAQMQLRGGTAPTSHDLAMAESAVAARLGYEPDRLAIAAMLEADPVPLDPVALTPLGESL